MFLSDCAVKLHNPMKVSYFQDLDLILHIQCNKITNPTMGKQSLTGTSVAEYGAPMLLHYSYAFKVQCFIGTSSVAPTLRFHYSCIYNVQCFKGASVAECGAPVLLLSLFMRLWCPVFDRYQCSWEYCSCATPLLFRHLEGPMLHIYQCSWECCPCATPLLFMRLQYPMFHRCQCSWV